MLRLAAWRGTDPDRLDSAWLDRHSSSLSAHGTSLTRDYHLHYFLETGHDWITRRLDVRASGNGWWRTLALVRGPSGHWSAKADSGGIQPTVDPAPTTPIDTDALADALDCDLGLCPLTNTMPVLRHGLLDAALQGHDRTEVLTMAWVSVPDLNVFASPQSYSAAGTTADGTALIDFQSGDFAEQIEIDREGLVVKYPKIGHRLAID
ncbi:hypothetical protein FDG2_2578 [Candidatus Protofrankia californiensis]|uniref:Glycolipid-binding domain-containing protein n=1 Tax=Candidatus Protofrankia californiensis TaxID=1839754 RepID=A0A1C3NXY7_9ACTN|nr:hypothetical protein FDG2_2578 [Candidatus Protofrankia californiensis]